MSVQLTPREYFPLVYQIPDTSDATTHYVRAVVKDANGTIETVNLTDQGSGRHYKNWQVPADGSGLGRWIDVTVTPYTDSGYTTASAVYGSQHNVYLVMDRVQRHEAASLGAAMVDYKRIGKMIEEAVSKVPTPEKVTIPEMPKMPEMPDVKPMMDACEAMMAKMESMHKDMAGGHQDGSMRMDSMMGEMRGMMADMREAMDAMHAERMLASDTNHGESMQRMDDMNYERVLQAADDIRQFLEKYLQRDDSVEAKIEDVKKAISNIAYLVLSKQPEKTESVPPFSEIA